MQNEDNKSETQNDKKANPESSSDFDQDLETICKNFKSFEYEFSKNKDDKRRED
jgi:hypothetical protein